jgi:hypothetical protein
MNARITLKTLTAMTLLAVSLGGATAYADQGVEIQRRPVPGWGDAPSFPPRGDDYREDARQDRIDLRQEELMDRILHGIEAGRLDSRETVMLLREQRDITKLERAFLRDGYLSRFEYQTLEDRLDDAERHISREQHDRPTR